MPKYRFAWTNFPPPLLKELADGLAIDGDPAVGLRQLFGARPKTAFIQEAWPILLEYWLPSDAVSRQFLAEELGSLGLGRVEIDIGRKQGQLAYLASCRNAVTLRKKVLTVFLVAGEPEPLVLSEAPAVAETIPDPPRDDGGLRGTHGCGGDGGDRLNDWIVRTLKQALGAEDTRDADGDILIHRGSAVLFVRPHDGKSPFLQVFAPLLTGFRPDPAIFEAINSLNSQVPFAKAFVTPDGSEIILEALLLVHSLSAADLVYVIDLVSGAADYFDTFLRQRFGGLA